MGVDISLKLNTITAYLVDYLIAILICFLGCLSKEIYKNKKKPRSKFSISSVMIGTILCAALLKLADRILKDRSIYFPPEAYVAVGFLFGFISDVFLSTLADKKTVSAIVIALFKTVGSLLNISAKSFIENYNSSKDSDIKPKYYDKNRLDKESNDEKPRGDPGT